MKNLALILISLLIITSCNTASDFDKYKQHVITLSSDEFEGRAPGTPGEPGTQCNPRKPDTTKTKVKKKLKERTRKEKTRV